MTPPEVTELAELLGHKLSPQLEVSYGQAISRTSAELGLTAAALLERARSGDRKVLAPLLASACIGETYFFRHPDHFEQLEAAARAAAAVGRPYRTAWSVGCSSGEEAWSLALTLAPHAPQLRVVGTDVSPTALERARQGRYSAWSLRGSSRRAGLLQAGPDGFEVPAALRDRVQFLEQNLAAGRVHPPAPLGQEVDVVFCRNVLVYLQASRVREVVRGLAAALSEGGLLVLGALDAPDGLEGLEPLGPPGIFSRPRAPLPRSRPPTRPPPLVRPAASTVTAAQRLADLGDLEGALACCAKLGDEPEALLLAASIHAERHEVDRAELLLRRILVRQPGHLGANLRMALLCVQRADAVALGRARERVEAALAGRADEAPAGYEDLTAGHVRRILAELAAEGSDSCAS